MRLYHPAQFVSMLACSVLAGAIVITTARQGNDIALPVVEQPDRFTAVVTAYSSCPRRFSFGTQFRIGSRIYTCWDRLHQRYDHRFDIWKPSKEEALRFGRQVLEIETL
jgi:hypothetical protein